VFLQQNTVALIEGNHTKTACALSTVTGIPLIRLHGNNSPFYQCEKAIQMTAEYRDYAKATLDILDTFHWEKIALVFDGKYSLANFNFKLLTMLVAFVCHTILSHFDEELKLLDQSCLVFIRRWSRLAMTHRSCWWLVHFQQFSLWLLMILFFFWLDAQ